MVLVASFVLFSGLRFDCWFWLWFRSWCGDLSCFFLTVWLPVLTSFDALLAAIFFHFGIG
jgi:hypothetical protein